MEKLNTKEMEVLKFLVKGFDNFKIGESMHLSVHTVKVHVSGIIRKLEAKNRTEAAFIAGKYKLIN